MSSTVEATLTLKLFDCCTCSSHIALTTLQEKRFRDNHEVFYCPLGHSQHFPAETEAERFRKALHAADIEKTRLAAQLAQASAAAEKVRQRAVAGVCPCCHRTFKQLQRHMKTKHPEQA